MKTNSDFKLSKSTKRILSTMLDNDKRNHWKRMMMDAESSEKRAKLAKLSGMKSNQGDE